MFEHRGSQKQLLAKTELDYWQKTAKMFLRWYNTIEIRKRFFISMIKTLKVNSSLSFVNMRERHLKSVLQLTLCKSNLSEDKSQNSDQC